LPMWLNLLTLISIPTSEWCLKLVFLQQSKFLKRICYLFINHFSLTSLS
jgi:hypothetical protein